MIDSGRSPSGRATRASTEPRVTPGLGHTASVPNAIERALRFLASWAETRLYGSPSERLFWRDLIAEAPQKIVDALHDDGLFIAKMGGTLPATADVSDDEPFRKIIRARVKLEPITLGAQHVFPTPYWYEAEYRVEVLPKMLARMMLRTQEDDVAAQIASAIEAQRAETTQIGPVHESATAEGGDAPTQSRTS